MFLLSSVFGATIAQGPNELWATGYIQDGLDGVFVGLCQAKSIHAVVVVDMFGDAKSRA